MNIPPEMPVDQVKEEEEPAKEVIATKVNLNKLSKPSSSHVHSDFYSKIPRIFANRQVGRVGVDLRPVGERHCEVVQRQVWVRIHQQERHQGRCVRPPGNAILINHRTTVLDGNSHKLAQSIMHCFRLPSSRTTQRRLLGLLATARLVKSLNLQCTFCVRGRLQLCIA